MIQKYRNNNYYQNIPQQYRSAMELCRTVGLFFPEGSKEDKFSIGVLDISETKYEFTSEFPSKWLGSFPKTVVSVWPTPCNDSKISFKNLILGSLSPCNTPPFDHQSISSFW